MKTHHKKSLDALRGIAVLLVVFHHWFVSPLGIAAYDVFIPFFRQYGSFGVDLFFVLSGFCIHNSYVGNKADFSAKNYALRRWWRIYPPYFFALGLAVVLNLMTNGYKLYAGDSVTLGNFGPLQILTHLFLVHNLSPLTLTTISGPFWTIALEAQFYLLYLLFRPFFYRNRDWAGVFIISILFYVMAWSMFLSHLKFLPLDAFRFWIEWVLGAFLVYLVRRKPAIIRYTPPAYLAGFLFFCTLLEAAGTLKMTWDFS